VGLFPTAGSMFPGGGSVRLIPEVRVSMFFDRSSVKNAMTKAEHKALSRASLLVRRTAQKSIRKMGMAKPKLAIMNAYSGMNLSQISRLPGASTERAGTARDSRGRFLKGSGARRSRDGRITERDRQKVIQRVREMKTKPPSAPGTPPHTHVPFGHMLGFRRNLYNAYDSQTHSAVVGPSKKGQDWQAPQLHEFGGSKRLVGYVWRPKYERYNKPIVRWVSPGTKLGDQWIPLGKSKTSSYPPRPFMRPALEKSRGRIAEMFRDILGR